MKPLSASPLEHRVRPGESLWTIARQHDTHVADICRLNGLKPDTSLHINQTLRLPADATPRPPSCPRPGGYVSIAESVVNLRRGPGEHHPRVGVARQGTRYRVVSTADQWTEVRLQAGRTAWIRNDLLFTNRDRVFPPKTVRRSRGRTIGKGYIAGGVVNVRTGPSLQAARVAQARRGTPVQVLEKRDLWWRVEFGNGVTGWVAQECIKTGRPSGVAYVKTAILNLRGGPGTGFAKVGQLRTGQPLVVHERRGDWARVRCSNGKFGWVARWLLKGRPAVQRGATRSSSRSSSWRTAAAVASTGGAGWRAVIATARRYMGVRYRIGGESPRTGFDCSGFVAYVLRKHGFHPPRTARAQYGMGVPVTRARLRTGDLVFFRNTYRRGISHVGLYVGNGQFIHASTSRGVRLTSLRDSYYAPRYAGGRRLK